MPSLVARAPAACVVLNQHSAPAALSMLFTVCYVPAAVQTKDELERTFFKRAIKMCQDVDNLVRLSSCQQLAAIGRTAGREAVQRIMLDELVELLKDEDVKVRKQS